MSFKGRILESAKRHDSRVVLSLDLWGPYYERLDRAKEVLRETQGRIAAVKVNQHLLLPFGLEGIKDIIEMCRREGLPLIADLKINDIEATNLNIVDSLFDFGFEALTANPFVGWREGLEKVVAKVHQKDGGILFLVYMSHSGAEEGYSLRLKSGKPIYRAFAERAKAWEADGIVVSAKSAEMIREARKTVGRGCLIFSPGVGAQGGDPREWYDTDADFMIVGRALTETSDPGRVLAKIVEQEGKQSART